MGKQNGSREAQGSRKMFTHLEESCAVRRSQVTSRGKLEQVEGAGVKSRVKSAVDEEVAESVAFSKQESDLPPGPGSLQRLHSSVSGGSQFHEM